MLEYKGYVAGIEYDDSVDELCASVINSGSYSVANAYARDVDGLKREFALSIDIYLESCAEQGIQPESPGQYSRAAGSCR